MTDLTAIYCRDRADAGDLRQRTRERHLQWMAAAPFPIAAAGPLLNDDGGMIGSLLIVQSGDVAAVREWAAGDPYAQAGLFASEGGVDILPWRHLIGGGLKQGALTAQG